jgi:hypothetical protein
MRHRPTGRFGAIRACPRSRGQRRAGETQRHRLNAAWPTYLSGTELRYWALIRSKVPHHLFGSTHSIPALGHRRGPVFGA